ncbi:GCN5-related N-acetyltransferase [Intrasporangium calvum DSM 43043]|uniref:GCN5-related N-acetyltransferase n=1 Tax=Intrasporangium calvum (strain ATCC 23552 / DSM 43043 / JCM 3097 / NBRC 12989 / NCIMB 10167 / NRRL B-3866 / 7 KIP) TaxID=710696 RepID=E6SD11_INTC7|nr:GCN5-related N-acetyltransferase [Intrasporangium calvum DSM 43043]
MAREATVTLRSVEPADGPFLVALYASTRVTELAALTWDAATMRAFLAQQFAAQAASWSTTFPDLDRLLVVVDGRRAGRLYVHRSPTLLHLVDIALLPALRGRGIGSVLLDRLIAEADAVGIPTTLHVARDNPARGLYERFGFRAVAEEPFHIRMTRPAPPVSRGRDG